MSPSAKRKQLKAPTDAVPTPLTAVSGDTCANCGEKGLRKYCRSCGQSRPTARDYSLWELAKEAFGEVTSYDGRIFRTARALFVHPGQLTRDHFEGRRAKYVGPFRIFVLANLFAWFAFPRLKLVGFNLKLAEKISIFHDFWLWALAQRSAFAEVTVEKFSERIEAASSAQNATAVLVMVPLFAFGAMLTMRGRGYRFVQHLVFTAHYYCIHLLTLLFVWGALLGPVARYLRDHPDASLRASVFPVLANPWFQHFIVAPFALPYLYRAMKRAYSLGARSAMMRSAVLVLWVCLLSRAFLDIGFALVIAFA